MKNKSSQTDLGVNPPPTPPHLKERVHRMQTETVNMKFKDLIKFSNILI